MIHLIYIYFIINAFIAGYGLADREKTDTLILYFLFGCLYLIWLTISGVSIGLWAKFSAYWMIKTWWRYFVINKPYKQGDILSKERVEAEIKKETIPTRWHKMIWKKFIKTHGLDIEI